MATFISHSPADTQALGEQWGHCAGPGLVIGLSGELGAGKTELVKGIARGLGITARVHSPSFALLHIYSGGRLPLFHMDLYRLDSLEQIESSGLGEHLAAGGLTVIEWVERWFGTRSEPAYLKTIPQPFRLVTIELLGPNDRRIAYEDFGN